MKKKKIIFVTGTRADYGKLKSIIVKLQKNHKFQTHVFVTGMHNLKDYGKTYVHLVRDKIKKQYCLENRIKLLIFSYTELDQIETLLNNNLKLKK
jgi:UDP-N-acetylglucosamine 2-epimerase (hydrolysing)